MSVCDVAIADDTLRRVEGLYEMESACTTINEKGEHQRCGPQVRDRLRIRRLSDKTAEFELYSVQINGHQCEVSGVAELVGDSLRYLDPEFEKDDPGQGVRITITDSALVLGYLKPLKSWPPFCGNRAYVSRLRFPYTTKLK